MDRLGADPALPARREAEAAAVHCKAPKIAASDADHRGSAGIAQGVKADGRSAGAAGHADDTQ